MTSNINNNLNQVVNPNCFHFYKNYRDYQLFVSDIYKYSWIIQVRDMDWTRVCWYTTIDWLDIYINWLDTIFTIYWE